MEVHYFDRQPEKGDLWYLEQMPDAKEDQVVFEKTPKYFVTPIAPKGLKRIDPNMKIILVMRDPVTRTLSDYVHERKLYQVQNKLSPQMVEKIYPSIDEMLLTSEGKVFNLLFFVVNEF